MNNTRERYSNDDNLSFWTVPRVEQYLHKEITDRLDQLTKELKDIKRILNMETDDGK